MNNKNVIEQFWDGNYASVNHLHTDGTKLISYHTCILQKTFDNISKEKVVIENTTKYSVTTSRHKNMAKQKNTSIKYVPTTTHVPRGTNDLTSYI